MSIKSYLPAFSLLLLVGCTQELENASEGREPEPAEPKLVLSVGIHHVDALAREPMVVEHPSGALFLAGYGSQVTGTDPRSVPHLWRSDDGGVSWKRVDVGRPEDGAIGNSDVDLTVAPDGTIYFASMGFDRGERAGTHVAIGVSGDVGASWNWSLVSETRFDDRPWVRVASDGTAHTVWNDDAGISHAVSTDGGGTWGERERIHPEGGSSHFAVGPAGELAVRISPIAASGNRFNEGVDLIAVSTDGGASWTKTEAPGTRDWDPTFSDPEKVPRWVEPLAWDDAGALYHLWSEGTVVKLARSTDAGGTWAEWSIAEEESVSFFPYLTSSGSGELAATWFVGGGDEMSVRVAHLQVGDEGEPSALLADLFQADTWQERDDERLRDPGGEYLPVLFLADGDLGVAAPIQDEASDRYGFSWWRLAIE